MLEKTLRVNRLFDVYGELLTGKQQRVLHLYFQKDWSLAEIAREEECSRQAVHDLLQRTTDRLETYERTLAVVRRNGRLRELIEQLVECLDEDGDGDEEPRREKARELARALRETV